MSSIFSVFVGVLVILFSILIMLLPALVELAVFGTTAP